jgi:hypothetical protein
MAADGVLLLYHRLSAPWQRDASTVSEHVGAFARHSRNRIWDVNVDLGFPPELAKLDFAAILLHYSLFGVGEYHLEREWLNYLDGSGAYKVAFFQDEYTGCRRRFSFLNNFGIDCVYTCLQPSEAAKVYGRHTAVDELVSNLPGYVSEVLVENSRRYTIPLGRRTVDVGYRGRPLLPYLGRGAMEKREIGERFGELARASGLRLDLATGEGDRLYGDDWLRFLANCRCVLGVESGASAFDLEDEVRTEYERLCAEGQDVAIEDLRTLRRWEDVVYYRTIGPRHFEAAAMNVCQVLFEGRYSDILQPMIHYVPLKKDYSNLDEVIGLIRDDAVCQGIAANAYRDLIESCEFSYARFVAQVDETLHAAMSAERDEPAPAAKVQEMLALGMTRRRWIRLAELARFAVVHSRPVQRLIALAHPLTIRVRKRLG